MCNERMEEEGSMHMSVVMQSVTPQLHMHVQYICVSVQYIHVHV